VGGTDVDELNTNMGEYVGHGWGLALGMKTMGQVCNLGHSMAEKSHYHEPSLTKKTGH
jgi:hypothetical protein